MTNRILHHPDGGICFGVVPEMNSRGVIIPSGGIRLLSGKHRGPNRGFGAQHIWAEHAAEMERKGFHGYDEVPAYVAHIIQNGTPLYFGGESWNRVTVMAVRASSGVAILDYKDRRDGAIWSVVTAYGGSRTHGTRVGTVR